jgi:hypothetical protein
MKIHFFIEDTHLPPKISKCTSSHLITRVMILVVRLGQLTDSDKRPRREITSGLKTCMVPWFCTQPTTGSEGELVTSDVQSSIPDRIEWHSGKIGACHLCEVLISNLGRTRSSCDRESHSLWERSFPRKLHSCKSPNKANNVQVYALLSIQYLISART